MQVKGFSLEKRFQNVGVTGERAFLIFGVDFIMDTSEQVEVEWTEETALQGRTRAEGHLIGRSWKHIAGNLCALDFFGERGYTWKGGAWVEKQFRLKS